MTTGTLQYKAVEISTAKFKMLNCALCLTSGDFIDNLSFCIECKLYYCPACLSNHLNSQQALWAQNRLQADKISTSAEDLRSKTGSNRNISKNDASTKRNSVETDSNGSLRDYDPVSQTDAYKSLANILRKKQFELLSLGTQKDAIINIMRQFREFTTDLLQEFETSIEEKVTAEEEKTKSEINREIQQLEKAMKDMNNNTSDEAVTQARSNASKADDEKGTDGGKNSVSESYSNMQMILETAIEDFTYRVNKTGSYLIEESDRLFVPSDKHEIRLKEDRSGCDINDMCQLDDGSLLLCDWNNMNIKRLGTSGSNKTESSGSNPSQPNGHGPNETDQQGNTRHGAEVTVREFCPMPSVPWAVCQTGPAEVAVSLFLLQRIQFVRVTATTMKQTRNFKVGEVCRGVCYTDSKLIVSCGGGGIGEGPGHLRIFNKFGTLLNTVHYKSPGDPVISCPFHLTIAEGLIYLTDREKGLVCLQWSGLHHLEPLESSPNHHLALAKGMCQGSARELYVCDFRNGTVVQLNTQTRLSRVVVEQRSRATGPQAVCYSRDRQRLVVASGNSDFVHTYQLQLIQACRNTYL